jgi:DNA-binding transcriptional ArsR family regulator
VNDGADGDALLSFLSALASPQRLRIVGALVGGRQYVSELARELRMSRPLLHMHLQRLEAAGVVSSTFELGSDGKAMKYFEVQPFAIELTPARIAAASQTLSEQPAHDRAERTE